jgi:putative peptide zinc metalloprotease protein
MDAAPPGHPAGPSGPSDLVTDSPDVAASATGRQAPRQLPELLPPLREDLNLLAAAPNRDGSPAWMIHDPAGNRFFRIGWLEFAMLSRWSLQDPRAMLRAVQSETGLAATPEELAALLAFLMQQQLLRAATAAASEYLAAVNASRRSTGLKWLLHNYLFIRFPLFRPGRFLRATMPLVRPLFSRTFVALVGVLTLLGLVLASQQWDVFRTTFQDKLTLDGLVCYMVALAVTKSLHELGHAYTATRYGVRVAHMGFALLVMWPVLYTDTSESWKLADRRQRFHIAGAGILVETMVAGLATLAWSLTENPALKSAFFFLATASWFISLTLNASPFMRFDGYYLLSDALDIPNLHERAAGLARVQLRRSLLGWDDPDPEAFPPRLRRFLVAFSWLTWAYRFFVFLSIATAVYLFFFKLLGIMLYMVEVGWFIVMPVYRELRVWRRRGGIQARRLGSWILLVVAVGAGWTLLADTHVRAPAWAHSADQYTLYSPLAARIVQAPQQAGPIRAGEVLYVLDAPELRNKAERADAAAQSLRAQLDGLQGIEGGEEKRAVLQGELARELAEGASQRAEMQRLTLRAPADGWLTDVDPQAVPGVWASPRQPLSVAIDPKAWLVDAYIGQQDLNAVKVGDGARFYPKGETGKPLNGHVVGIDTARTLYLPNPMLDAEHGGQIASRTAKDGQMQPRDVLYRVQIALDQPPAMAAARPGRAVIEAQAAAGLPQWMKDLASLVIRESGF